MTLRIPPSINSKPDCGLMGARSTFGASLILVINLLALLLAGVGQLVLLGE